MLYKEARKEFRRHTVHLLGSQCLFISFILVFPKSLGFLRLKGKLQRATNSSTSALASQLASVGTSMYRNTLLKMTLVWGSMLKSDMLKVFIEFFKTGIINMGVNATFIVLIPKKEGATELSDFRPISLINNLYKIIVKVLSLRLRKVMDKIISPS